MSNVNSKNARVGRTVEALRSSLWDLMNRIGAGAEKWSIEQWITHEPDCCKRQKVAASALSWLESSEGTDFVKAKEGRELDRQRVNAARDYRRGLSAARANQLSSNR